MLAFDPKFRKMIVLDMQQIAKEQKKKKFVKVNPSVFKLNEAFRTKKHKLLFDDLLIFYNQIEYLVFDYK